VSQSLLVGLGVRRIHPRPQHKRPPVCAICAHAFLVTIHITFETVNSRIRVRTCNCNHINITTNTNNTNNNTETHSHTNTDQCFSICIYISIVTVIKAATTASPTPSPSPPFPTVNYQPGVFTRFVPVDSRVPV
jgi:hypothetical protein